MTTIQPNTLLDDLHPSRFLKVTDLTERWKVAQITVAISRMTTEETIPNPADVDPATRKPRVVMQPVLYFKQKAKLPAISEAPEFPRGYLLAAQVDVQSLKSATGAATVGDLIGKRITITVGEHKRKAVLRISPTTPE
jgi:hypothetical protein